MGIHSPNIIANSIISCAKYNGNAEIIVFGDQRIKWSQLKSRIFKIAQALIKLGIQKNDKIAFMFHNTPEFIEINYAAHVAGAIPVPLNYRFMPKEIEYQGNHSDAKLLIYDSIWSEAIEPSMPNLTKIKRVICKGKSVLDNIIDYEEFVNSGEDIDPEVETNEDDVIVIIYTGGTTGFPKGVMLTYGAHFELFSKLMAYATVRSLTMELPPNRHKKMMESLPIPGGRLLAPLFRTKRFKKLIKRQETYNKLEKKFYSIFTDPEVARKRYNYITKSMYPSMPFFHDASYASLVMAELSGNICFILPDSVKFDPEIIFKTIEKEKVNTLANVPTGWKKLISHPNAKNYDLSSIRITSTGGGTCSVSIKKDILNLFPNTILLDAFGQTEMTPVTSFRIDADPKKLKDRSVGKLIVKAKIVNEQGNEVSQGETGEIMYQSNTIMKGYYKDDKATEKALDKGWFHSGDLGYFDEVGEIRVVDRKKECINTGGEKVFPLEVEDIIQKHPSVEDVCIIGTPDEEWGNTIRAIVQLKNKDTVIQKDIIEFCKDKIAGYKIPRSVIFVDELPRSAVGKMLRQKIRELYGQAPSVDKILK